MFPKPITPKDKKYLEWVRSQPCCVRGDRSCEIHAHHIRGNGMAMKCSDYGTVPLSSDLHHEVHLTGKKTFQHKYDINFEEIVRELNERWERMKKEKVLENLVKLEIETERKLEKSKFKEEAFREALDNQTIQSHGFLVILQDIATQRKEIEDELKNP